MTTRTEKALETLTRAIEAERAANSQIAAAASLFVAGKLDMAELTRFSTKADNAAQARNDAERAYRTSYQAA